MTDTKHWKIFFAFRQSESEASRPPSTDVELPVGRPGSPTSTEKDILRYYYYIHHGIDTGEGLSWKK